MKIPCTLIGKSKWAEETNNEELAIFNQDNYIALTIDEVDILFDILKKFKESFI